MTLSEGEREILIKNNIEKAVNSVSEVSFLISNSKYSLAVNRIYYGIFYSLTALALKNNFSTSKHNHLLSWFNTEYVYKGKVDKKYGRFAYQAYDKRAKSDYDVFATFEKAEVEELFKQMSEFIEMISGLL